MEAVRAGRYRPGRRPSLNRGGTVMKDTGTGMPLTGGPGAGTSGVSEPSFVEALVNPTSVFRHPQEIAHHPWFTDHEKRAVLLSWGRDELIAEQLASKTVPELKLTSCMDAVVDVLARYDPLVVSEYRSALATIRRGPKQRFHRNALH